MEAPTIAAALAAAAAFGAGVLCAGAQAAAEPPAPPAAAKDLLSVAVGANTRYILSTSGRPSSLERYRRLLQEVLCLDVAYTPISAPGPRKFLHKQLLAILAPYIALFSAR